MIKKIHTNTAKKLLKQGESLIACPNKMYPDGPIRFDIPVKYNNDYTFNEWWNKFTNSFVYYNCTNETGNRISWYKIIRKDKSKIGN